MTSLIFERPLGFLVVPLLLTTNLSNLPFMLPDLLCAPVSLLVFKSGLTVPFIPLDLEIPVVGPVDRPQESKALFPRSRRYKMDFR
jgi:hypothetical protein